MDDQIKLTQNGQIPSDQITAGQAPVQQQAQDTATQAGGKEGAPIAIPKPPEQVIQETAPEVAVPQDVSESGVEAVKSEVINVSPELQAQGVQPAGTAVPLPEEPTLHLPITEDKAQGILKVHKKVKESVTWLAMLVVRQMQILRFKQEKKEEKS